jgi:hypothetical protein
MKLDPFVRVMISQCSQLQPTNSIYEQEEL